MVGQRVFLAVGRAWAWIKDACFPLECVGCKQEGSLWCDACRAGFLFLRRQTCPSCDTPTPYGRVCHKHVGALDGVVSLSLYGNPQIRSLIRQWKFHGVRAVEPLWEELVERWGTEAQPVPTRAWTVTWVPMHAWKRRHRGFNQAEVLARCVGMSLGTPVEERLERSRYVWVPQARKTKDRRRRAHVLPRVVGEVPAYVIVVDDVYTTGATMQACAEALKRAGAKEVWGVVLARGND